MLAHARLKLYEYSGDKSWITNPTYKMVRLNEWNTIWEPDYSVPELAQKLLEKK